MEHQIDINDYLSEMIQQCEKLMALNRTKDVGTSAFTTVILNSLGRLGLDELSKIQTEILRRKKNHSVDFLALLQNIQFILCFRFARSKTRWDSHVPSLNDMLLAFGADNSIFQFNYFGACTTHRAEKITSLKIENTVDSFFYEEDYKPLTTRDVNKYRALAEANDPLALAILHANDVQEKTRYNVSAVFFDVERQLQFLAQDPEKCC